MKIITLLLIVAACLSGSPAWAAGPIESWGETPSHGEPHKLAIPDGHAYAGAYIDFGQREDEVTLERIERFDELVGQQQAIVAFSSDWGNQSFPEKQLRIIANYGAVPLVYWSPWDRPGDYKAPPGGGRFDLEAILAGRWDAYIDFWATEAREYIRKYGEPILVSWGLEMNGDWFPWSGFFYGKGKPVDGCANCFAGPELYKKTYRYVVDRVRANGVSNIIWVWHPNNSSSPDEPWNAMAQYYPGPDYVDWLALSAYGTQYPSQGWISVDEAMNVYYQRLCRVDPNKPIMLGEWGRRGVSQGRQQGAVDRRIPRTGAQGFSEAPGCGFLARTLAKRGSVDQQSPGQFFPRVPRSLPKGDCRPLLAFQAPLRAVNLAGE